MKLWNLFSNSKILLIRMGTYHWLQNGCGRPYICKFIHFQIISKLRFEEINSHEIKSIIFGPVSLNWFQTIFGLFSERLWIVADHFCIVLNRFRTVFLFFALSSLSWTCHHCCFCRRCHRYLFIPLPGPPRQLNSPRRLQDAFKTPLDAPETPPSRPKLPWNINSTLLSVSIAFVIRFFIFFTFQAP